MESILLQSIDLIFQLSFIFFEIVYYWYQWGSLFINNFDNFFWQFGFYCVNNFLNVFIRDSELLRDRRSVILKSISGLFWHISMLYTFSLSMICWKMWPYNSTNMFSIMSIFCRLSRTNKLIREWLKAVNLWYGLPLLK